MWCRKKELLTKSKSGAYIDELLKHIPTTLTDEEAEIRNSSVQLIKMAIEGKLWEGFCLITFLVIQTMHILF